MTHFSTSKLQYVRWCNIARELGYTAQESLQTYPTCNPFVKCFQIFGTVCFLPHPANTRRSHDWTASVRRCKAHVYLHSRYERPRDSENNVTRPAIQEQFISWYFAAHVMSHPVLEDTAGKEWSTILHFKYNPLLNINQLSDIPRRYWKSVTVCNLYRV